MILKYDENYKVVYVVKHFTRLYCNCNSGFFPFSSSSYHYYLICIYVHACDINNNEILKKIQQTHIQKVKH